MLCGARGLHCISPLRLYGCSTRLWPHAPKPCLHALACTCTCRCAMAESELRLAVGALQRAEEAHQREVRVCAGVCVVCVCLRMCVE